MQTSEFSRPHELKHAIRLHRRAIVEAAKQRGIELSDHRVGAVANAAVAKGVVECADVTVPGGHPPMRVIDGATFVDDLQRFLDTNPIPEVDDTPQPTPPRTGPRDLLHRAAWTSPTRWMVERFLRTPKAVFEYARWGPLRPMQNRKEIGRLLALMQASHPSTVLEIGTANGGTTYLLSHFTAPTGTVVTCDLAPRTDAASLRRGSRRRQRVDVLQLDSHDAGSRAQLHGRLRDGVDLLFIDGDHSYEGVRQDFLDYADLLRPGAILVFHDIVEDFRTRYGIITNAWVGGVPRLWKELRDVLPAAFAAHEFVADVHQDGFGIGAIVCPDVPQPGTTLLEAYARRG